MSDTTVEVDLQTAKEGDRTFYRLAYKGVTSPELRSEDACRVYLKQGHFEQLLRGMDVVTATAAHAAMKINAMGDRQLTEALDPPRIVIPFAQ